MIVIKVYMRGCGGMKVTVAPTARPVHEAMKELPDAIKDSSILRTFWDQNHGWRGAPLSIRGPQKRFWARVYGYFQ